MLRKSKLAVEIGFGKLFVIRNAMKFVICAPPPAPTPPSGDQTSECVITGTVVGCEECCDVDTCVVKETTYCSGLKGKRPKPSSIVVMAPVLAVEE